MRYAHLADLHLGSWREPKMRELSLKAFLAVLDECIQNQVDFILFSGDVFNTSLPSLDTLKVVAGKLKQLKDLEIPLYVIAGSHDFSPSGKTMIDVLENAGLLKNVCKGFVEPETNLLHLNFTIDPKTGAKMTGLLGRKGLLDKTYYQNLSLENLEQEPGYKIFLFHTTLSELKPSHLQQMESHPASFLPKNFDYYAGGHVHHPTKVELPGYGTLTYPGALFPNNFAEMERYGQGGYYLITAENGAQQVSWKPLKVIQHFSIVLDCSHKSPEVSTYDLLQQFQEAELRDTVITIRLHGILKGGRVSDLNFKEIFNQLYARGAYFVMKNTSGLSSEEFSEIKNANTNPETIEEQTIREHLQQVKLFDLETELHLTKALLASLNTSKKEGETTTDFQARVETEADLLLGLGRG